MLSLKRRCRRVVFPGASASRGMCACNAAAWPGAFESCPWWGKSRWEVDLCRNWAGVLNGPWCCRCCSDAEAVVAETCCWSKPQMTSVHCRWVKSVLCSVLYPSCMLRLVFVWDRRVKEAVAVFRSLPEPCVCKITGVLWCRRMVWPSFESSPVPLAPSPPLPWLPRV